MCLFYTFAHLRELPITHTLSAHIKDVRIGGSVSGWNSVEDDDSVCQVSGHDEVVLHHECSLLCVKDESSQQLKKWISAIVNQTHKNCLESVADVTVWWPWQPSDAAQSPDTLTARRSDTHPQVFLNTEPKPHAAAHRRTDSGPAETQSVCLNTHAFIY